jgi:hypothetical protein
MTLFLDRTIGQKVGHFSLNCPNWLTDPVVNPNFENKIGSFWSIQN